MLQGWVVVTVSFAYVGLLFAIAYYFDRRADQGRSLISNPYIYALSIGVYCTSWTFYGSVGRAASDGIGFLPIYLGPTLVFVLWWLVLRKMLRISKIYRLTSIADFIGSRYGKSGALAGLVTVIAVLGTTPYIALQLKAVSTSFTVLLSYPEIASFAGARRSILEDNAFHVSLLMAAFAILFGTRHIDASEHHEGMVAAIAFESLVKLIAFLTIGIFVTFGLYGGFGDLFQTARTDPDIARLFTAGGNFETWLPLLLVSMAAIVCLPRQFQMTVVENTDEDHLRKAAWLFPLYLMVINIFVIPIAVSGLVHFPGPDADADFFVLTLPLAEGQDLLAMFVFLGGLSAATGMVIVATVSLSTMICNDLIMPVLLRWEKLRLNQYEDLSGLLLTIRRGAILLLLLLGYGYYRLVGEAAALVTIGLVSFVAAAQFAPALIGGIFWKGASRKGAIVGLALGFGAWAYTLLLPLFSQSGLLPYSFVESGPFGIALLKPHALFGLSGMDSLSHALFWSMTLNIGALIFVSVSTHQRSIDRVQAALFVDVFLRREDERDTAFWRGSATVAELQDLVGRFIGHGRAARAFQRHARARAINLGQITEADAELINFAERLLAGAIGAASARVMVSSVAKGEMLGIDEIMKILSETSQVIEYSRRLEQNSRELEARTEELRTANERLKEIDRLKDDFLSTVSHELRTPLTSIKSFSEILLDNPNLDEEQRRSFLKTVVKETERLTRLINHILDLAKLEAGRMEWQMEDVDAREIIDDALAAAQGILAERSVELKVDFQPGLPKVFVDRDRLLQVIVNLVANAVKFCEEGKGRILVSAHENGGVLLVSVTDNGPGVPQENRDKIFEKYHENSQALVSGTRGTGLGLAISRQIVEFFGGKIWVDNVAAGGARFSFTVPLRLASFVPAAK